MSLSAHQKWCCCDAFQDTVKIIGSEAGADALILFNGKIDEKLSCAENFKYARTAHGAGRGRRMRKTAARQMQDGRTPCQAALLPL
jgi:hypothetical protein